MIPQETKQNDFRVVLRLILRGLAIISILFVAIRGVSAAQLKLEQRNPDPANQSWFYIDLILEPAGETINAVEGKITFPPELLNLYAISDGNSIVNLWAVKPQLTADGTVAFSGVIPGGYLDSNGLLLSLVLQAKQNGTAQLTLNESRALLNDGQGTPAKLTTNVLTLPLTASATSFKPPVYDEASPENFTPLISSNPNVYNGKHFLVFSTQDKGSGLDHYAVYESRQAIDPAAVNAGDWQTAASPYLLIDQSLGSFIYVAAVDRAGKSRIVVLAPTKPTFYQQLSSKEKIFAIISGVIIVAIFLAVSIWLILRRHKKWHEANRRDQFKN